MRNRRSVKHRNRTRIFFPKYIATYSSTSEAGNANFPLKIQNTHTHTHTKATIATSKCLRSSRTWTGSIWRIALEKRQIKFPQNSTRTTRTMGELCRISYVSFVLFRYFNDTSNPPLLTYRSSTLLFAKFRTKKTAVQ